MNILDIQNPKFLKKLKKKDLEKLSEDIRKFLIEKPDLEWIKNNIDERVYISINNYIKGE